MPDEMSCLAKCPKCILADLIDQTFIEKSIKYDLYGDVPYSKAYITLVLYY